MSSINITKDKMISLRLNGMAKAVDEWLLSPEMKNYDIEECLGFFIDREESFRKNKKYEARLKSAKLKHRGNLESFDFSAERNLPKVQVLKLAQLDWILNQENILITGPTGVGKSYLANSLGERACREGYRVTCKRFTTILEEFITARAMGKVLSYIESYSRMDVLIIDDWCFQPITSAQCKDIFEIIEIRHGLKPTIFTSQIPVNGWYETMNESTAADAIMDRILSKSQIIEIKGGSMRRAKTK